MGTPWSRLRCIFAEEASSLVHSAKRSAAMRVNSPLRPNPVLNRSARRRRCRVPAALRVSAPG